jgi:hypothetical protein
VKKRNKNKRTDGPAYPGGESISSCPKRIVTTKQSGPSGEGNGITGHISLPRPRRVSDTLAQRHGQAMWLCCVHRLVAAALPCPRLHTLDGVEFRCCLDGKIDGLRSSRSRGPASRINRVVSGRYSSPAMRSRADQQPCSWSCT